MNFIYSELITVRKKGLYYVAQSILTTERSLFFKVLDFAIPSSNLYVHMWETAKHHIHCIKSRNPQFLSAGGASHDVATVKLYEKKKSGNTYRKGKNLKLTKVDNPVCSNSSKAEKGLHWQESSSFIFLGKTNGKSLTGIYKCCILLNSEISDNKAREKETKGLNFTEFAIWKCHHSKAYIDSRKYTRGQDLGEYKQEGISIQKTLVCGN